MPKFYSSIILLTNQLKEICEKQFSVFSSKGGQISPLMHVLTGLVSRFAVKSTQALIDMRDNDVRTARLRKER